MGRAGPQALGLKPETAELLYGPTQRAPAAGLAVAANKAIGSYQSIAGASTKGGIVGNTIGLSQKMQVNGSSVEDLLAAARRPFNSASEQTVLARAWDKYAGRAGGSFAPLSGNMAKKFCCGEIS